MKFAALFVPLAEPRFASGPAEHRMIVTNMHQQYFIIPETLGLLLVELHMNFLSAH